MWTPSAETSFERLKQVMIQAPVLTLLDFNKQFVVECDASGVGIGAVLRQGRPIAFLSQALQGKQLFLSTYEKEIPTLSYLRCSCSTQRCCWAWVKSNSSK